LRMPLRSLTRYRMGSMNETALAVGGCLTNGIQF